MRAAWLVFPTLTMLAFFSCTCDSTVPVGTPCSTNDDCGTLECVGGSCQEPGTGGSDAGTDESDAGETDAGPTCIPEREACVGGQGLPCCSGVCDAAPGQPGTCEREGVCGPDGDPCVNPTDCCSLSCVNGKCSSNACKQIGAGCGSAGECCSGTCTNGACAQVPGATCKTLGESCTGKTDCCSQNCQNNVCVRASWCGASGDICYRALDCCNGGCQLPAGGGPGTCVSSLTGAGGGNCQVGGEPCTGPTNCCSAVCSDLGT
ncbi:MAG: hypothetical protein ACK4N5_10020, partial [Myxococcales bacterium]